MDRVSHRYPDPFAGPWRLTFHFAELNGIAECVGLDVRSFKETVTESGDRVTQPVGGALTPVSASLVRSLPVAGLVTSAVKDFAHLLGWTADGEEGTNPQARQAARDALPRYERHQGSRTYWTRERLAEVADVYAQALALKQRPTQAVAGTFNLSPSMAAKLVGRCRKEGLLDPTTPGKAGGAKPRRKRTATPALTGPAGAGQ